MPRDAQAALLDPPAIRALPGAREWRGVASERAALVDRILTHLCRRRAEVEWAFKRNLSETSPLSLAIHIVRHAGRGDPACEGCEAQLPIRLLRAMAQEAERGAA